MVKIIKISLLSVIAILLLDACSREQMGYNSKKWGDTTDFIFHLSNLLNFYTATYNTLPNSIDDILIFIDGMDNVSGGVFDNQYEYFTINKDKLIVLSELIDSKPYVAIYYKEVEDRNLVIKVPFRGYCEEQFLDRIHFFDKRGHYTWDGDETYSRFDSINNHLTRISHKFPGGMRLDTINDRWRFSRIGVEYTHDKLRDLCTNRSIDFQQSLFFTQIYEYLDSIAVANDYSRIIVSSFVDKDIKYND